MKYLIILSSMFYTYSLSAQKVDSSLQLIHQTNTISGMYDPIWNYNNAPFKHTITAYGDIYTGSNSITTNFLKNIYNSGFLDSTLKNTVSENLEELNRVGVTAFGGIGFTIQDENMFHGNAILTGGFEYNLQQTADFTPDVFHLVFYGNYDLQDSIAKLDKTTFNSIKYNKYRLGIILPDTVSDGTITTAFFVNFIQGISTNFININTGAFYTSPYGTYIDFAYDFSAQNTQPDSSIFDWRGSGAALDVFFEYHWPKIGLKFFTSAIDLGFVSWYDNTKKITADTTILFEGIDVDNLLNATTSLFTQDTLFNLLGVTETELTFTKILPIKLNAGFVKEFSPTFYAALGAQHIFNNTYVPLVYIKSGKIFPKTGTAIEGIVETGGYGGLNVGFGISQRITKHASIQLNASNFLGLIVPDRLTGAAAFISLHSSF